MRKLEENRGNPWVDIVRRERGEGGGGRGREREREGEGERERGREREREREMREGKAMEIRSALHIFWCCCRGKSQPSGKERVGSSAAFLIGPTHTSPIFLLPVEVIYHNVSGGVGEVISAWSCRFPGRARIGGCALDVTRSRGRRLGCSES